MFFRVAFQGLIKIRDVEHFSTRSNDGTIIRDQ